MTPGRGSSWRIRPGSGGLDSEGPSGCIQRLDGEERRLDGGQGMDHGVRESKLLQEILRTHIEP